MSKLAVSLLALFYLLCVENAYARMPCPSVWYDEFAYGQPTRSLNGNGGWSGSAATDIYAWDNWCCLVSGGSGSIDSNKTGLNFYGSGGIVWVHTDVLGYHDNANTMWSIYIDDELGRTHARIYGSCNWFAGRSGSDVTATQSLTDRGFHDVDIKINTIAHTADFYNKGVWFGQLSYPNSQSARVDRVKIERMSNAAATNAWLLIGDIYVGQEDVAPPTIPGTPFRSAACQSLIKFNWAPSAPSCSGLAGYQVQVGTTQGASNIADTWVGKTTSYQFTGNTGTTYYCRVYARDNVGNQSAWSGVGSSAAVSFPPALQVDGKPFFPMGYYTSTSHASVEEARSYLSVQRAQGMNSVLSCYGIWLNSDLMVNEVEGAAIMDMQVAMEVHRWAVKGDPGYPPSLIDDQVDLLKNHPNMLGWYLLDEPEVQGISAGALQARYTQIKDRDPDRSIWVVHYAYPPMNPARPALNYLAAEPPPYCDVLMTDTYPVGYGSAEFAGPLWYVASESKAHTDMAVSFGKRAYIHVPQVQGYQEFNTRLPTYPEQRYLAYAPVICGARSLFFWMYNAYTTPEHLENVVAPIAREISGLIPAIVSNSTDVCVTSNRDVDTLNHDIADVTYMFGEDSRGGYLIASNNTPDTVSVTFHLAGDVLAAKYGTQDASVPVMFESRSVTSHYTGSPGTRTLTDTFSSYDVNVYRLYTLANKLSIDLGSPDMTDGITHPQVEDGDTVAVANIWGVNCKRNSILAGPPPDSYFYFGLSDDFAFQGSVPAVAIEISYYDSGTGALELHYDATDSPYKSAGTVALTGTNRWKTHRFHVADAYLGNRQSGAADFRIFGGTGNTFYLDKITVEPGIAVTSMVEAKKYADGISIELTAIPATAGTDQMGGDFYIEDPNLPCGIRVRPAASVVLEGAVVDVFGALDTLDSGERVITGAVVTPSEETVEQPAPLGLSNRSLGGSDLGYSAGPPKLGQQGVNDGAGLNNIGLLVTVWGRVTEIENAQPATWFKIEDGSGTPVKCITPQGVTIDPAWQYAVVIGISSCERNGSGLHRVLRARKPGDIMPDWQTSQ